MDRVAKPVPMLIIICLIIIIAFLLRERSVLEGIWKLSKATRARSVQRQDQEGLATFVFSSVLAATAGIMLVSRSGNAVPRR